MSVTLKGACLPLLIKEVCDRGDFLPCQLQIPLCPPRPLFHDTNLTDASDWLVQL